jgi:hypothetical protein
MALGSTQPLIEMSTRNLPGGKRRPAHKAENLTFIYEPTVLKNMGASTSHYPMGLHDLLHLFLLHLEVFSVHISPPKPVSITTSFLCITLFIFNDSAPRVTTDFVIREAMLSFVIRGIPRFTNFCYNLVC